MRRFNASQWLWVLLAACVVAPVHARSYHVDAMVGQVNGRAIYTREVLEPIHEQLATLGRELPPETFRARAATLIASRLSAMVTDALIYGEAQRDLSDIERHGLTSAVQRQREQLLREYGQGSPAVAEANLLEQTGLTLDETLEQWRQTAVIQRYINQKIRPKVNVTRKDVKRYYDEHQDQFNPPATRTVRVIQVTNQQDAGAISQMLEAGTPFELAAADPINTFRRDSGGLMGDMAGDQLFADPDINDATLKLRARELRRPIRIRRQMVVRLPRKGQQAQGPVADGHAGPDPRHPLRAAVPRIL